MRRANRRFPAWAWPDVTVSLERVPQQGSSHERVKVLHVITKFVDGAGGNTLLSVLGSDPDRFEMWVAGAPGGPLWERATAAGVHAVHLPRMRAPIAPLDDIRVTLELARLMKRHRFAIVHTHSSKAGFVGRLAAFLARTPVVVHTIHGFAWHDYMNPIRRFVYKALERAVRPVTDAFLAVAPDVAREAVETSVAPPDRVSVVPSAIELDVVPERPDPSVRDELGISRDAPLVGTVGRFDDQKAPIDFVRMAEVVRSRWPDARFVMVGEGPLAQAVQAECAKRELDVLFTGYRADASRVASAFDVYVVSSIYEGLGRSLCEALASGRPVAASAVNGVVDIVEDGVTGLLAPPRDPLRLADKVSWILMHPEEARVMGEIAQTRVRSLFDPRVMCGLIEVTYDQLLGNRVLSTSHRDVAVMH